MRNVVVKDFIENLYQKCVANGIKLPADKMQATTELWNEAGGLVFDAERSYDVRPLSLVFFLFLDNRCQICCVISLAEY